MTRTCATCSHCVAIVNGWECYIQLDPREKRPKRLPVALEYGCWHWLGRT